MGHVTLAVSEKTIDKLLDEIRNKKVTFEGDGQSKPQRGFSLRYSMKFRIDNGKLELLDDNILKVRELDIIFEKLEISLSVKLQQQCGNFPCLIVDPGRCSLRHPTIEVCVFQGSPIISSSMIDIAPLVKHCELSFRGNPVSKQDGDHWTINLKLLPGIDVDLFDIADGFGGQLVSQLIAEAQKLIPGGNNKLVKEIIKALGGSLESFILKMLDAPDDIEEWIADKLKFETDIFDLAIRLAVKKIKLSEIPDPFVLMKAEAELTPVTIPIQDLQAYVNNQEMVLDMTLKQ